MQLSKKSRNFNKFGQGHWETCGKSGDFLSKLLVTSGWEVLGGAEWRWLWMGEVFDNNACYLEVCLRVNVCKNEAVADSLRDVNLFPSCW